MCVIVGHKLIKGDKVNRAEMLAVLEPFKGHDNYQSAYLKLGCFIDDIESNVIDLVDFNTGISVSLSELKDLNIIDDSGLVEFIDDNVNESKKTLNNLAENLY